MSTKPEWLHEPDAADLLHIKTSTLRNMRRDRITAIVACLRECMARGSCDPLGFLSQQIFPPTRPRLVIDAFFIYAIGHTCMSLLEVSTSLSIHKSLVSEYLGCKD